MTKRRSLAVATAAGVLLLAGLLTGCRPYSGSTPVGGGYKCYGKVGIAAPASGDDEVRINLPTSGDRSCVAPDGYRAVASMRVFTAASPNGFVVQVPVAGELRYRYRNVSKVRFRLQYRTACDTAIIDVDAGTATHDPVACS